MIERPAPDARTRGLDLAARILALAAGGLLTGLAALVVASIGGRSCCGAPIPGDYELVQAIVAISVSLCLPWCQLHRGNIAVDFFTAGLTPRSQIRLDGIGSLLLGLMMAVVAWRTAVGAADMRAAGETSMILGLPVWLGYAAMVPGLALTALAGFHVGVDDLRRSYRWPG